MKMYSITLALDVAVELGLTSPCSPILLICSWAEESDNQPSVMART
jgi:hypothetical protein